VDTTSGHDVVVREARPSRSRSGGL
jgi:hypothetical protein